jgi:hypothetical protein
VARRYTLRGGDTLYRIALRMYKRHGAWRQIADANGIRGVSPDDADELAAWAKRHDRTSLRIAVYMANTPLRLRDR